MAKIVKISVEMTIVEARALIDVMGRVDDHNLLQNEERGPVSWVMSRIAHKVYKAEEQNLQEVNHG